MFTFKWLAVPSLCAALIFAPASMALAETSTHGKKPHKAAKKSKKSAVAMSKKSKVAPMSKTAEKPIEAHAAKIAPKSAKKKVAAMSSTAPTKKGKSKKKSHKHA
jgi:hypothetical protein